MNITMKKQNQLTLEEGDEKFLLKCVIRNPSPKTIEYCKNGYERFSNYLAKETLLSEIYSETIDRYVLNLREKTNANDITIVDMGEPVLWLTFGVYQHSEIERSRYFVAPG